jgi:hypothetical protein
MDFGRGPLLNCRLDDKSGQMGLGGAGGGAAEQTQQFWILTYLNLEMTNVCRAVLLSSTNYFQDKWPHPCLLLKRLPRTNSTPSVVIRRVWKHC